MRKQIFCFIGFVTLLVTAVSVHSAEPAYHFLKEIPVGGEGGWDYLSIDSAARRLYVAHATKIIVIDLAGDKIVGEIADTPGVHGFAIAPKLGRGFSSNGKENKAGIVDLKTLKTISKISTGENPDAILFEPEHAEVYTFNGRGHSVTVFAAESGKIIATIPLSGKPEFAVVDEKSHRIYCNIEDKNELAAVDTRTHQVVNTWPIAPGESASGLAMDLAHHRLFLGCDNNLMVMMDSETGKVITTVPIGSRVDATAFDPGTQLAFSSNGEGNTTIAREENFNKLTVVQNLKTEPGARTMALDPKTHRIYLATATFEKAGGNSQRPKALNGTFKILVYGMGE